MVGGKPLLRRWWEKERIVVLSAREVEREEKGKTYQGGS